MIIPNKPVTSWTFPLIGQPDSMSEKVKKDISSFLKFYVLKINSYFLRIFLTLPAIGLVLQSTTTTAGCTTKRVPSWPECSRCWLFGCSWILKIKKIWNQNFSTRFKANLFTKFIISEGVPQYSKWRFCTEEILRMSKKASYFYHVPNSYQSHPRGFDK